MAGSSLARRRQTPHIFEMTQTPKTEPKPAEPKIEPQPPAKAVEIGGPKGLEPTRYGDWERAGRCVDF